MKPVDPDDPAVADVIADWKRTPGTVGIRIMMTKESGRDPGDPGLDRILRAAVRYDFPVNMLCWGNVDAGAALIDRHPDTRFIIDHDSGEETMLKATILFAVGLCVNVLIGLPAMAQAPAEVTLTRIDCGTGATPTDVGQRFTDTFAYKHLKLTFTFSCYLIKHGNEYMVWDTGFAPGTSPNAPKVGIVDRLKELKITPEQVKYVGISHFHGDHTGQLAPFTNATLLIGKGDWDGITAPTPMQGANVAGFKTWISEGRKVEPLTGDKDVFGDGSVIVLRMPGHTPGHSGLLVRLKDMGPVLLTGDLVHFRENYESGGVPSFNFDRAATVASIERMKQIVTNLKATVVIQHDMRDIGKLPAFPAAAK